MSQINRIRMECWIECVIQERLEIKNSKLQTNDSAPWSLAKYFKDYFSILFSITKKSKMLCPNINPESDQMIYVSINYLKL